MQIVLENILLNASVYQIFVCKKINLKFWINVN